MVFFENLLADFEVFLETNLWFAPLSGILLPFLEALLPWLPLTALVTFNLSILSGLYGPVGGLVATVILSVTGSFLGMLLIFIFIRATLAKYFVKKVESSSAGRKFLDIVDRKNTGLILVLMSNPFLPSSILNYALSLTRIKMGKYLLLTFLSRIVIIVFLVFLGSLFHIPENPWNIVWVMLAYFGLAVLFALIDKRRGKTDPPAE